MRTLEKQIGERANKAISEKAFPGCVVGVIRKEGGPTVLPFGRFTYDSDARVVQDTTMYDLASVTKVIPTTSILLYLVDRGEVALHDSVAKYLPLFNNHPGKEQVTIWHLLTFTLDLVVPSTASLKDRSPQDIIDTFVSAPLRKPPGSSHLYTNSTSLLSGLVIRAATGKTVDVCADEFFFKPLGMDRTTFHPEKFPKNMFPPTEVDEWRKDVVQGVVHDEASYVLRNTCQLGIAGLFSSTLGLLTFLQMLLNKGSCRGNRIFSKKIISEMHTNQLASIDEEMGLGWDINKKHKMGNMSSERVFGHSGFTGCMVMCDPVREAGIVTLSNRTYPTRPSDGIAINTFRRDIADIVFSQL